MFRILVSLAVSIGLSVAAAQDVRVDTTASPQRALLSVTAPVGGADAYTLAVDSVLSVTDPAYGLLSNDADPDGDELTVITYNNTDLQGSVTVFSNGRFTYTPPDGFSGTDTFTYRMRDASNEQSDDIPVTFTLVETNRTPLGQPDLYVTKTDSVLTIPVERGVLANDLDPDGGALTVITYNNSTLQGSLALFSDGRLNYTPSAGFSGTDTFTYRMRDASNAQSEDVTVTIEVIETNRPPIGTPDAYTVLTDSTLQVTDPGVGVLRNDLDPDGEELTVFTYNNTSLQGSLSLFSNGRFTYTPPDGFSGTDTFTYRMRDASNAQSEHVTVTFVVVSDVGTVEDVTPPVCGDIQVREDSRGGVRLDLTVGDPESGIASVTLASLVNLDGFIEGIRRRPGTAIQFEPGTASVDIQANVLDSTVGHDLAVDIVNGVGLSETCAAVTTPAEKPPQSFSVGVPSPNPSSDRVRFEFALPTGQHTELVIFDAQGREVARVLDRPFESGVHEVVWEPQQLPAGTYRYRLRAGADEAVGALTVVQ